MNSQDGARTTLFCATNPNAPRWSGRYVLPFGKVNGKLDEWIENANTVDSLWEASERMAKERGVK